MITAGKGRLMYREVDIAKLAVAIVEMVQDQEGDALMKCAALHAAAEVFNQTVMNQSLIVTMQKNMQ